MLVVNIAPIQSMRFAPVDPNRGSFVAVSYELSGGDLNAIQEGDLSTVEAAETVEWAFFIGVEPALIWAKERADLISVQLGDGPSYSAGETKLLPSVGVDSPQDFGVWPGAEAIPEPPTGWSPALDAERIAERIEYLNHFHGDTLETSVDDAPAGEHLRATFKCEDVDEDGEDVGPVIVWDLQADRLAWESPIWMRISDARKLAEMKAWQFGLDC